MLKIAICDDNNVQNEMTVEMLNDYCEAKHRIANIDVFDSESALVEAVQSGINMTFICLM